MTTITAAILNSNKKALREPTVLEVEIKYMIKNPALIKRFLVESRDRYAAKSKITKSVDLIYDSGLLDKPNFIMTRYGTADPLLFKKKHRLISELRDFYKINVATETVLDKKEDTKQYKKSFARVKCRLTIPMKDGQFDITQVYRMDDVLNPGVIQNARNTLFNKIQDNGTPAEKYDQFIVNFSNSCITSTEMEFEFRPDLEFEDKHLSAEYALSLVGDDIGVVLSQYRILKDVAHAVFPGSKIRSLKSMLNNAVSITKNDYNDIYPPTDWYVTPKADGYTALLITNMAGKNYVYSEYATYLVTPTDKSVNSLKPELTVFVGEIIPEKSGGHKFLCYDLLIDDGANITTLRFKERLDRMSLAFADPIELQDSYGNITTAELKEHILITSDLQGSLRMVSELVTDYEIDGYILVSPDEGYQTTKNYKIKDHHTIDFLVVEVPAAMKKKNLLYSGENTHLLFCSITPNELEKIMIDKIPEYTKLFPRISVFGNFPIPIQFSPIDDPTAYIWHPSEKDAKMLREEAKNGRLICELEYVPKYEKDNEVPVEGDWKFIKLREDRRNEPNYFGNNLLKTAEIEWLISKYPLRLKEMHLPISTYFEKSKSDLYFAQTAATRFGIFTVMEFVSKMIKNGSKTAVDLCSGRGQDLNKYHKLGFNKLICIEKDSTALAELVARRFVLIRNPKSNYKMNIKIMHRDLNENADDTLSMFAALNNGVPEEVGMVVCNLAIHYLVGTPTGLTNVIKLIRGLTSIGTHFVFTCMSGRAVMDLLGKTGEWKYHQQNLLKYHIIKNFEGDQLLEHGQTIKTKLPFSDILYEEPLVNLEHINSMFARLGFNVVSTGSFANYIPEFKKNTPGVANLLTPEDIQYIGLYHFTVLARVK